MCMILIVRGMQHRLALALAGILALCGEAAAQEQPRVGVVVRAGADPPVSASAVLAAVDSVVGDAAELLAEPRFHADSVLRERLVPFKRARQLADEGWRAYHEVEPAFAESRLVQARQRALEVVDLQGGPELFAEISLRLGAVRLSRGRASEARSDLRLAARMAPDRAVTHAEFRPTVVALYTAAKADEGSRAGLTVDAPAGADVFIDGVSVGGAADAGAAGIATEVTVGHHVVGVHKRGYHARARIVVVSGRGERVAVVLERDELAAALDAPLELGVAEAEAELRVEAATIYGELDAYVLIAPAWRRGAPALLAQRCERVPTRCTEVVEVGFGDSDGLGAAAQRMWRALAERRGSRRFPPTLLVDARLTRGEPRPGTIRRDPHRAWWKSGWLWAGVGTAAVAASAWVLLSQDDRTDTVITLEPCGFGGACAE